MQITFALGQEQKRRRLIQKAGDLDPAAPVANELSLVIEDPLEAAGGSQAAGDDQPQSWPSLPRNKSGKQRHESLNRNNKQKRPARSGLLGAILSPFVGRRQK